VTGQTAIQAVESVTEIKGHEELIGIPLVAAQQLSDDVHDGLATALASDSKLQGLEILPSFFGGCCGKRLSDEAAPCFIDSNRPQATILLAQRCDGASADPAANSWMRITFREQLKNASDLPEDLVLATWREGILEVMRTQAGKTCGCPTRERAYGVIDDKKTPCQKRCKGCACEHAATCCKILYRQCDVPEQK